MKNIEILKRSFSGGFIRDVMSGFIPVLIVIVASQLGFIVAIAFGVEGPLSLFMSGTSVGIFCGWAACHFCSVVWRDRLLDRQFQLLELAAIMLAGNRHRNDEERVEGDEWKDL